MDTLNMLVLVNLALTVFLLVAALFMWSVLWRIRMDVLLIKHYENPDRIVKTTEERVASEHIEAAARADLDFTDALCRIHDDHIGESAQTTVELLMKAIIHKNKQAKLFAHRR